MCFSAAIREPPATCSRPLQSRHFALANVARASKSRTSKSLTTASRSASSTTAWKASPTPNRFIGQSPPTSITRQPQRRKLAALYYERWEIETALDELRTHLRGARIILRSKTPDLVRQEFFGLMMAHFAIRSLMHDTALKADEDPDRLSFLHAVRVLRRKLPSFGAIPPSAANRLP